jgi:holo-[acyl-carrier protein] synthase
MIPPIMGAAMGWRNIDIRKKPSGEPFLVLSGPAEELAVKRGVTSAPITLSYTDHHGWPVLCWKRKDDAE